MAVPLQASITLRSPATRTTLGAALNERIADTGRLLGMVQRAHWNVCGEHAFLPVHRMFGKLAHKLFRVTDALANRARTLGVYVAQPGGAPIRIPDYPADITSPTDHLKEVSTRLAVLIGLLRQTRDLAEEKDEDQTADMLTEVLRKLEAKGRRLLNSMTEPERQGAMNAAQALLGGVQNAAGGTPGAAPAPARPPKR